MPAARASHPPSASGSGEIQVFRLYVSSASPVSARALVNARRFFDRHLPGRYRLEIVKPDVLGTDSPETDPTTSPETAALEKLTNATLLTAVKKLNPDQQECIVLRFLQGFTVAETARTMGKNEGAVQALQYRAVRTLARLLPDGFRG